MLDFIVPSDRDGEQQGTKTAKLLPPAVRTAVQRQCHVAWLLSRYFNRNKGVVATG